MHLPLRICGTAGIRCRPDLVIQSAVGFDRIRSQRQTPIQLNLNNTHSLLCPSPLALPQPQIVAQTHLHGQTHSQEPDVSIPTNSIRPRLSAVEQESLQVLEWPSVCRQVWGPKQSFAPLSPSSCPLACHVGGHEQLIQISRSRDTDNPEPESYHSSLPGRMLLQYCHGHRACGLRAAAHWELKG